MRIRIVIVVALLIIVLLVLYGETMSSIFFRNDAIKGNDNKLQMKDMIEAYVNIMSNYEVDDASIPSSDKDRYAMLEELGAFRKRLKASSEGEFLITPVDELMERIHVQIRLKEYAKAENHFFSPLLFLKEQVRTLQPLMSIASVNTIEEKREHTEKLREVIVDLMGQRPPVVPLNGRTVKKVEYESYTIEKIIFESELGVSVPGYLLIPHTISLPAPAIITLHQHEGRYRLGADELIGTAVGFDEPQSHAKALAERGYITFAIDARCFGERVDDEDITHCLAEWIGRNLLGMIIWDDIRSIDYLLTRKEVDASRI